MGEPATNSKAQQDSGQHVPVHKSLQSYSWFIVHHPVLCASVGFLIPIFISIIGFQVYPLEINTSAGSWYPRSSAIGGTEDGLLRGEEETVFNPDSVNSSAIRIPRQESLSTQLTLYFWRPDKGNILTTEGLAKMRKVEKYVYDQEDFPKYCLRTSKGSCTEAKGITSYVYSPADATCPAYRTPDGSGTAQWSTSVPTMLNPLLQSSNPNVYCSGCNQSCVFQSNSSLDAFVAKDFSDTTLKTFATKSQIFFGMPLAGYANSQDRYSEQKEKIDDFIATLRKYLRDEASDAVISVLAAHPLLFELHFQDLMVRDGVLILLSITLVGLFVLWHTRSPFLTVFGMLHVILSFPFAYFFMQAIFDIGPMGILNFMSMFIILGIGADDIFILLDAWKQSAHAVKAPASDGADEFEVRMSQLQRRFEWTFRRAAWAMLVTSLTTSAAFLMNIVSAVVPIKIFGIFTAFMVMTNFFMVITYYPALVIVWEEYIKHHCCTSCACCRCNEKESVSFLAAGDAPVSNLKPTDDVVPNIEDYRWLERKLHSVFAPWLHRNHRAVAGGFVVLTIMCAVFASQVSVSQEAAQWVPSDDPTQQIIDLEREDFTRSSRVNQVWYVAGMDPIDRAGTNGFNVEDIGNAVFLPTFDMSSEAAQQAYVDNCDDMLTWDNVRKTDGVNEVLCPMWEFRAYVQTVLNETFPVPATQFIDRLVRFTKYIEARNGPATDVSVLNSIDDREFRREKVAGLEQTIRFLARASPPKLAYMCTVLNSTIGVQLPAKETRPLYTYFNDKVATLQTAEPGYYTTYQTAQEYLWMRLEELLLENALFAMLISLTIAFLIVWVSTRDVGLSLMSALTIFGIVLTLMATMVWISWEISVIESICLTILVGLSVDFTIHLANSWQVSSSHKHRILRLKSTVLEIGISVVAAASTTFLACVPLFLCYIIFYNRFGLFIALTVLWSIIYSFGFFLSCESMFGSVTDRDDFHWLWLAVQGKDRGPAWRNGQMQIEPRVTELSMLASHDITDVPDDGTAGSSRKVSSV
eukprot:m.678196 g.678196  ORF g.678196 m.678196 type:complete len:1033 (+) comp22804_c1_seq2:366-3464(+)